MSRRHEIYEKLKIALEDVEQEQYFSIFDILIYLTLYSSLEREDDDLENLEENDDENEAAVINDNDAYQSEFLKEIKSEFKLEYDFISDNI